MAASPSTTFTSIIRSPYIPCHNDVRQVHSILTADLGFPTELADMIIDFAEYWPVLETSRKEHVSVGGSYTNGNNTALLYLLLDEPIPKPQGEEHVVVRDVKFRIKSCDQGWSDDRRDHGTYRGSWTWFEACILRQQRPDAAARPRRPSAILQHDPAYAWDFDGWGVAWHNAPLERERKVTWRLQTNVCASGHVREHEIVWSRHEKEPVAEGSGDGAGFVAALRPGDYIGVWAKAQASSNRYI